MRTRRMLCHGAKGAEKEEVISYVHVDETPDLHWIWHYEGHLWPWTLGFRLWNEAFLYCFYQCDFEQVI